MGNKDTSESIAIDLSEAQLMMRSLSTYRFYPFYRRPHPWFTDEENKSDDHLHEYLACFRDLYLADGSTDGKRLELTQPQAQTILKALEGCHFEMHDNPNDLHTLLDLDEPEPLVKLAERLKSYLVSFKSS